MHPSSLRTKGTSISGVRNLAWVVRETARHHSGMNSVMPSMRTTLLLINRRAWPLVRCCGDYTNSCRLCRDLLRITLT